MEIIDVVDKSGGLVGLIGCKVKVDEEDSAIGSAATEVEGMGAGDAVVDDEDVDDDVACTVDSG